MNELFKITKRETLLVVAGMLTIMALIIANIAASYVMDCFGIPTDGGIFVFPLTYIVGDLVVELYGDRTADMLSNWAAWIAFFAILSLAALGLFPGHSEYAETNAAFIASHGFSLRITAGSLVAYVLSRKTNNWAFIKIKRAQWHTETTKRMLGPNSSIIVKASYRSVSDEIDKANVTVDKDGRARNIRGYRLRELGSSLLGRLVDNVIFETVAFLGQATTATFFLQMGMAYLEGLAVEVVLILFVTQPLANLCRNYINRDIETV